jgi:hypothetical protein
MNTPTRLGLFGAALGVVFAAAFAAANAVVPASTVARWTDAAREHEMSTGNTGQGGQEQSGGPAENGDHAAATTQDSVRGVTSARGGYLLSPVTGPREVGQAGTLSFRILDERGRAVTRFVESHDKQLHLIVVRTDGAYFRHVHPVVDEEGTWSLSWDWAAAGTYRLFADFVSATGQEPVTLTRTVDVAGNFAPAPAAPSDTASVDGLTVELTGGLAVGSSSPLTFTVVRGGEAVTNLQPYLGAFGHLVALREGDMAYLHVHPEGDEPAAGELSGQDIEFAAKAPTPGRYLLYLDFKIDGQVHTARFVVDTGSMAAPAAPHGEPEEPAPASEGGTDSNAEADDGHDDH